VSKKRNQPCPCRSGKRYKKCCGLKGEALAVSGAQTAQENVSSGSSVAEFLTTGATAACQGHFDEAEACFRQAVKLKPDYAIAFNNLGLALHDQGKLNEAETNLRKALSLTPDFAEAHNNLGMVLHSSGKPDEAEACFRQAIKLKPGYTIAFNNLGLALHDQGKLDEAEANLHKALSLTPDFAETYINLGIILNSQGKLEEAIASYRQALTLRPNYAEAHYNLGITFGDQGKLAESEASLRQALQLNPNYTEAYNNLGLTLHSSGKQDEAEACFRQALELNPDSAKVYKSLSLFTKKSEIDDVLISMEKLYKRKGLPDEDQIDLGFALGKSFENLGDYEKSFNFILNANQVKRKSYTYSIENDRELFERIKKTFSPGFFSSHQGSSNPDKTPIFILGMPRSGTSLVEQILASHPLVFGAGELLFLANTVNKICAEGGAGKFPECIPELGMEGFERIGSEYIEKIRQYSDSAQHITDKLPHNFLHLGLINKLLPNAKVIHCVRSPRDNCLSIFKTDFMEQLHKYAYDLVEIGQYYNLYLDLMAHWENVLPGCMYTIKYEEMVSDQQNQIKGLLDFCNLPWDDACLDFHKTKRKVVTASVAQVRRPIYKDSIELWKRYENQLEPLRKELG
jgi:tetratricopeptide (TPR) repeat protein